MASCVLGPGVVPSTHHSRAWSSRTNDSFASRTGQDQALYGPIHLTQPLPEDIHSCKESSHKIRTASATLIASSPLVMWSWLWTHASTLEAPLLSRRPRLAAACARLQRPAHLDSPTHSLRPRVPPMFCTLPARVACWVCPARQSAPQHEKTRRTLHQRAWKRSTCWAHGCRASTHLESRKLFKSSTVVRRIEIIGAVRAHAREDGKQC